MDPLTIIAIIEALLQLAGQVPELIVAGETAVGLLRSGAAPTAAQQSLINAGLDAANTALAAS